jgi:hypothetical protein
LAFESSDSQGFEVDSFTENFNLFCIEEAVGIFLKITQIERARSRVQLSSGCYPDFSPHTSPTREKVVGPDKKRAASSFGNEALLLRRSGLAGHLPRVNFHIHI